MSIISYIERRILGKNRYNWYIERKARYHSHKSRLFSNVDIIETNSTEKTTVVCMFDGKILQGGLADRLRGILSVYKVCKDLDIKFKLYFVHPFDITLYLLPNKVNWTISKEEIKNKIGKKSILYLDSVDGSNYEKKKQYNWLCRKIKKQSGQLRVYTNAEFSYNEDFMLLFNELFIINTNLSNSLNNNKLLLGSNYISISCRFMNLLGDFNETYSQKTLTELQRKEMINANINKIKEIHAQSPSKIILVNSDSITFLNHAKVLNFTYIIPGNITHIDNDSRQDYATYEKTFLDFFMIANASEILLFKHNEMYNSGYPYAASLIYNKPFKRLDF